MFKKSCPGLAVSILISLFSIFVSSGIVFAQAEDEKRASKQVYSIEVQNNLIDLKANQASFKEILNDLEKKTGIKVNIFDGVEDKKVTLDIRSLPVYAIHTLLEKMELENFAVVYDKKIDSKAIFIIPKGQSVDKFIKNKKVLFVSQKSTDNRSNVSTIDSPMIEELKTSNFNLLVSNSAVVFVGRVDSLQLIITAKNIIYTEYTFKIEDYWKGNTNNKTLTVRNLGGVDAEKNLAMFTEHSYYLEVSAKYLVFLRPGFPDSVLPFIRVFSIVGEEIFNEEGQQLTMISSKNQLVFLDVPSFKSLHYVSRSKEVLRPIKEQSDPVPVTPNVSIGSPTPSQIKKLENTGAKISLEELKTYLTK